MLVFNALGSVVALSDNSASLVETYSYSPYGIPSHTSSIGNPYYYTGRRYDAETGLYYYRARYYNPGSGRFLQVDPIGFAGGMNLYAYVGNDPVDFVDPDGLRVSVVYRPLKDGAFGLGYHQAISVNGKIYGFSKNVGVINENPANYDWGSHEKVIYHGNEHDKAFRDYLKNAEDGNDPRFTKDTYGLCTNNCMSFVNTALQEAIQQEDFSYSK